MTFYIHVPTMTYPVKESQIKAKILSEQPNTSFAKPFVPPETYAPVAQTSPPPSHPFFQSVDELTPLKIGSQWTQQWALRDATPEEMEARKAVLVASITAQTQERLDNFARTRNYDGILSACTYASSQVERFAKEGQYCVNARDATWASLYEYMAKVEAGINPIPAGFQDIEPILPELVWPA